MEEIELLWNCHTINPPQIRLELYRLISMILSTGPLAEIGSERCRTVDGDLDLDRDNYRLEKLPSRYLFNEISRILIYTAIQARLYATTTPPAAQSFELWEKPCGEVENASARDLRLGSGPLGGRILPLTLKEALNKIIHSTVINVDTEPGDPNQDDLGKLNPILYLYGTHMSGASWRATLDLLGFVRLLDRVIPDWD